MGELLDYFLTFAKVGAFTFGGGYAMMPILQREIVERKGWATKEEVIDYYAVGQCLPGLNSVNTAIFVGCQNKKAPGGIAAGLGLVTPSIVIITIIAMFLRGFMEIAAVQNAFAAVRVAVCALVLQAAVGMAKSGVVDRPTAVIFTLSLGVMLLTPVSPIPVILVTGLAGILLRCRKGGGEAEK